MAEWSPRGRRRPRRWARPLLRGLLVATLAAPLLSPAAPRPASAAPQPYNTRLLMTSDVGALQDSVVTDGKVVAWMDTRGALFAHTLADGQERRLLDGPARRGQLALDNDTLVWAERDGAGAAIRGLRLGGGDPFTIAAGRGERNGPALSGNTVVWRDRRGGGWDLYGYDLAERREFPILVDDRTVGAVSIAGGTLVFEEYRAGRWNLTGYDLPSRREYQITNGPDDDTAPWTQGAVAFLRRPAGKSAAAVMLRDLRSGAERTIVAGHLALRPVLNGDLVVWEDWRTGLPNIHAFDRASSSEFALTRSEQARVPAVAGPVVVWLTKGQFSGRVTTVRLVAPLPTDPQDAPAVPDPNARYFQETRHTVAGAFLAFWRTNGAQDLFGLPLTEAFEETGVDGIRRRVQYFERVRLEADPRDPSRVAIGRLGLEMTEGRAFAPVAPVQETSEVRYVAQTQHTLRGWFKEYWETSGAAEVFGNPISEELVESGRTVQYFERVRFELKPNGTNARNGVWLGDLGREALVKRGWLPPAPAEGRGGLE